MTDLLSLTLAAHGGLDRWRALTGFDGHLTGGGALFDRKGYPGAFDSIDLAGRCQAQEMSLSPFLRPGQRTRVRPGHAAIEDEAGGVLAERDDPASAFPADREARWDDLNLAWFSGYALWNYLTAPFLFTFPGVATQELPAVERDGVVLRRLLVRFPDTVMTHCREQTFFIDPAGLIVRMDYAATATGSIPAANFASDHRRVGGGIVMPLRRRVVPIGPDGEPMHQMVVVALDIDRLDYR
jgi:hypothetical protein